MVPDPATALGGAKLVRDILTAPLRQRVRISLVLLPTIGTILLSWIWADTTWLWIIAISALLFWTLVLAIAEWLLEYVETVKNHRYREQILHDLSPEEKGLLGRYIYGDTKTQYFAMSDGVANGLANQTVLYIAAKTSINMDVIAFNIQPWAWDYLRSHRELLLNSEGKPCQYKSLHSGIF